MDDCIAYSVQGIYVINSLTKNTRILNLSSSAIRFPEAGIEISSER